MLCAIMAPTETRITQAAGDSHRHEEEQPMAVDRELIKTLAEANGLSIPDERLDMVLRQYQGFLRTLAEIDAVPMEKEVEPAITYSNALPSLIPGDAAERK
jgi:hypothetical protein